MSLIMRCPEDWTDQDEYNVYPDCHIWTPFYLIMDGFIIVSAFVCFMFASCKTCNSQGHKKQVATVATVQSLTMFCCYTTRLWTGLVTGHRNAALNFFYSISLGCVWIAYALITLQYWEVILAAKRLKGKSEVLLKNVRTVFRIFMVGMFFGCILAFMVPTLVPSLRIEISYWILAIIGIAVYTLMIWYSGMVVRTLLTSMQVSHSFYKRMIRKLDIFLFPWTFVAVPIMIIIIVILTTPFFLQNMYVLFGMISWSAEVGIGLILLSISGSIYGSPGKRKRQKGKKHRDAVKEAKLAAKTPSESKAECSTSAPLIPSQIGSPDMTPERSSRSINNYQTQTISIPQLEDRKSNSTKSASLRISMSPTANISSEPTTPIPLSPSGDLSQPSPHEIVPTPEKEEETTATTPPTTPPPTTTTIEERNNSPNEIRRETSLLLQHTNNELDETLSSSRMDLDQSMTTSGSHEIFLGVQSR